MVWPFNRSSPAVEAKSLAEPEAWLVEMFGGASPASVISLSTNDALRVPAVSSAIRVISEAASSLDVMVKALADDGTETDAPEHPVARFLRGPGPNDWTGWPELIADLVADALISDAGGVAHVSRTSDGRIVEVFRYRRGNVTIERDPITDEPRYSIDNRPIPAASLIHVTPPLGRAPLNAAKDAIAVAAVLERHAARLFGRGARPSGVLKFPATMGEEAVKKARAGWRASHETGEDTGRTAVLYGGAEFEPLQLTSTDAQFLELRKFQVLEIARAFRVPPSMLYELDRATWSNTEQLGREFLTYTLEPHLLALEAALRRALFLPDERAAFAIRFDRDDLTRADMTTRATAINSLIASRVLNPNEGRAWLGLAPRTGGDEFLNPNIDTGSAR